MGNFMGLFSTLRSITKVEKMLQVMKMNDGKILEFKRSMRVGDLLIYYPNYYVGIFEDAKMALPLDYMLKIGKLYYLIPCFTTSLEPRETNDGAKRIKVVITRQQVEQLLSNRMTIEDIVMGIEKMSSPSMNNLESIPEENELWY